MYDVVIIGAGVSGCAIARELSRYEVKAVVLEKALDVCEGTSKANSGIVHAGYDARPGSLKARLNVEGSRKMAALSRELDFPYKQNGSLVLCFDEKEKDKLEELKIRGEANGVDGLCILSREQLVEKEPNVGEGAVAALYAPSGAIVCPFGLTIALAENAAVNGVEFEFGTEVSGIESQECGYLVHTQKADYETRTVINAAGVRADEIHNMVSHMKMKITPRKGEYLLYDKKAGGLAVHTLFQLPTALGKGILATPTVHGNLLLGPTAQDIPEKDGTDTSREGLEQIVEKAALSIRHIPKKDVITSFAGLRAHITAYACEQEKDGGAKGDFVIGEVPDAPGFIDVAGIESPGLTSAPAIGEYVADMVKQLLGLREKAVFTSRRKGIPSMSLLSDEERHRLIKENPAYGNVICRCEMVTEGEIIDAIKRPLGAVTTDGIKRRTRAGMGRCQSGFCNPRVVEILARELGREESGIRKSGEDSWYILPSKEGGSL
ncbi:MAG: NAD(P)/FAD-dependent oxidoreductase [Lachnospiraceae bacterium]|nr:NAD(P)/FAD-dependent oxidoreductase [Lachnospiraceae bacterium]MDE7334482.1 NAD(P)/FAD-dependent oxidoreductase [Lachnospiraceae bacterium]